MVKMVLMELMELRYIILFVAIATAPIAPTECIPDFLKLPISYVAS